MSISLSELGLRELTVFGSQRFETELDEAVELLAQHPFLAQVISHDFPIHEADAAFAKALDSAASTKVIIKVGALGTLNSPRSCGQAKPTAAAS